MKKFWKWLDWIIWSYLERLQNFIIFRVSWRNEFFFWRIKTPIIMFIQRKLYNLYKEEQK